MNKPTYATAAKASVALSVLFIVIYGGCNWITGQRADVGTWFYAWEQSIPLVPPMIVPYMSIDLFFVAAPFLCQSHRELRVFKIRIVSCILFGGFCFLAMPLQLGVPRPQFSGWEGVIFRFLHSFDQPYNLCPSLHIALRAILAAIYGRHTRGLLRVVVQAWFVLVGLSTVLIGQHHVVDVIGGFILGLFCVYLIREEQTPWPVIPNFRVAAYYLVGCLAALGLTVAGWPAAFFLLWPAIALGMVASAYCGVGPRIYRKMHGEITFSARVILAPFFFGQYASLLYYRRQGPPWNRLAPKVWIGAQLNAREAADVTRQGVTAVLDLTAEFAETPVFLQLTYRNIAVLDLTGLTLDQLREAVAFIIEESAKGVVYVHCKSGFSRSAAVAGAYLLATRQATTVDGALAILRQARPTIVIRPETHQALQAFFASL